MFFWTLHSKKASHLVEKDQERNIFQNSQESVSCPENIQRNPYMNSEKLVAGNIILPRVRLTQPYC